MRKLQLVIAILFFEIANGRAQDASDSSIIVKFEKEISVQDVEVHYIERKAIITPNEN